MAPASSDPAGPMAHHCEDAKRGNVDPKASRQQLLRTAAGLDGPTAPMPLDIQSNGKVSTGDGSAAKEGLSYSALYDHLYSRPLQPNKSVPKPSRQAQAQEPSASRVVASDVYATSKTRPLLGRAWHRTDWLRVVWTATAHVVCLAAPSTFSWPMLYLTCALQFLTGCLGITLSYHRQLTHRAFRTPKWLEYFFAYCGVLAAQGDPIDWVSHHRVHHLHCDTPLDPHSPYEGFWYSHVGWLMDAEALNDRMGEKHHAEDLESQPFYMFLKKTYGLHVMGMLAALYAIGGWPGIVWAGAVRLVWVYHSTWLVNSASHIWGSQPYKTGDLSRNNWWVALVTYGEWHNNHHAFPYSARSGIEWWEVDTVWIIVAGLRAVGLAWDVKVPSDKAKMAVRMPSDKAKMAVKLH